jgi:ABC-type polar amino acid transport system ATPase subunit
VGTSNSPLLELSQVGLTLAKNPIFADISLAVREGDRIAICGRSGVGKTTLLRCVSLLVPMSSGEIRYDGDLVAQADGRRLRWLMDENLYRSQIVMVFQGFNLWPNRTVRENIMEGPLFIKHLKLQEARERAENLAERFDISAKLDSYPGELSGGQRQRVALARGLAMEPRVLLLDEITSSLDPPLAADVLFYLEKELTGVTLLFVTHYLEFARSLGTRFIFLHKTASSEPAGIFLDRPVDELDGSLQIVPQFKEYFQPLARLR